MANVHEKKISFGDKFAHGIQNNRKIILLVCISILLVIIAFGIFSHVSDKAKERSMVAIEHAETLYTEWKALPSDSQDRLTKADELKESLLAIADSNKNGYPDMKANYLLGLIMFSLEDYTNAITYFTSVSTDYADSYLAPVAKMNEAVSYEMLGQSDNAINTYQSIVDDYADTSAEVPHALFSIGRIYDELGNTELAIAVYEQVVSDYADSEWAKLSQSRLIVIK